ncbi:capsular polysaccharide synthesis protein-domain-containing protein [Pelagophyceae sp. CCMP2097]|nr:capsular polysaccharide synthesis protein-domain-containing protein [Pelagophyceae sp. CCMP2097]
MLSELGASAARSSARSWARCLVLAALVRFGGAAAASDDADGSRVIWRYWAQGPSQQPPLVRKCEESWRLHNPTWAVRTLDARAALALLAKETQFGWINDAFNFSRTPAFSDILRTEILTKYGGAWADSTLLCTRPLDDWLPLDFDLFLFTVSNWKNRIASWFLFCPAPDARNMRKLRDAVRMQWPVSTKPPGKPIEYFWWHRTVNGLQDPGFQNLLTRIRSNAAYDAPVRLAGPHLFAPYVKLSKLFASDADLARAPLYKFSLHHPAIKDLLICDGDWAKRARGTAVQKVLCPLKQS